MAFYFSSETMAFYDSDVFPAASLPENKVEITEAVYTELMTKQNQGYVIKADNSGNPYAVAQGEAAATDMKHSGSIATTLALGHVKIGNTMQTGNDGTLDLKDGAVTTSKIADSNVTTAKIADENVTTDKLADGAVTEDKLDSVKALEADETTLTMDEDANGFTLSVKDGGIGTQQIADQSVTTAKIADANVTTPKIADAAVTTQKIAIGAVTSEQILTDAVNTSKIRDSAVTTAKIRDGHVTTAKIALGAVTTEQILDDAVTGAKIRDGHVTTAKIADQAVTSVKIDKVRGPNLDLLNVFDRGTTIEVTGDSSSSEKEIDVYQVQNCLAGSIFRFTVGFKNISIYPFLSVRIKVKDGGGNIVGTVYESGLSGTDWRYYSILGKCEAAGTILVSFTLPISSGETKRPDVSIDGFVIK